jgi:Macrocin-O-methyltransferase (TylF)
MATAEQFTISSLASAEEQEIRSRFYDTYRSSPLPPAEQLDNLGLFISRQSLSRILFMHELYCQVLDVPGVVLEFGTRWGQNLVLFENFRGIYEPFNHPRKIVGFDTFEGFPAVDPRDGKASVVVEGSHSVTAGYENYLASVLDYHERESPISHIVKYEIVKGDVVDTLPGWLETHPETVIALAYFDLDLYTPTRECLRAITPRLTRGSVICFDELNHPEFPGETAAVMEVLGVDRVRLRRSPLTTYQSYLVID